MYKCKVCGRRFSGGERRDKSQVITDYIEGKQTVAQLAARYHVSEKTIRRDLKGMHYVQKISRDRHYGPYLCSYVNFIRYLLSDII